MTRKTRRGTAAALMAAALVAAAPVVCAEDSPQPEVSIIDITEDTLPEPSGDYLPTKIWVEEEDGTRLLKKTCVVNAGVSPSGLREGGSSSRGVDYQY